MLALRYPNADLASIWRGYEPRQRIREFKTWLAHPSNQPSLFFVDDIDGFKDETLIQAALPREARVILYSTRDPSIVGSLGRDSQDYLIPTMDVDEMASLMNQVLHRSGQRFAHASISEQDLEAIANVIDGHALGACRAIAYILNPLAHTTEKPATAFLDMFCGSDWKARRKFLDYKPRMGLSIMETFQISLQRIRRNNVEALNLLELISFLNGRDPRTNFRVFLGLERPWLDDLRDCLPNYGIFALGLAGQSEYLADLESVSLGIRPHFTSPLMIHSLWLECIQQRAGHVTRICWLRQVLLLCHASWERDEFDHFDILRPFVDNALAIAARFQISLDDVVESEEMKDWLHNVEIDEPEDPSVESESSGDLEGLSPVAAASPEIRPEESPIEDHGIQEHMLKKMVALCDDCQAANNLTSLKVEKMSETAFASIQQRFFRLLIRLRSLEDERTIQAPVSRLYKVKHRAVYDHMIEMAPTLQSKNPLLVSQLMKGKEAIGD